MLQAMFNHLSHQPEQIFEGLKIDTRANRSSIMSKGQYDSYCDTFGVRVLMKGPNGRKIKLIGSLQNALGFIMIQVPSGD